MQMLRAEVLETMLYGWITWSPRAGNYHHSVPIRCIGWRENNRTDLPISYLDILMKTASESIVAIMRRRRILLAGFVARMEDIRLPKRVMFGKLMGGAGCVGGGRKK